MKEGNLFDTIDYLRILNRKERFHLLLGVLGKTTFCLADHFRTELESCLSDSLNGALSIPSHAFAAMDFHLDWIAMALHLATKGPQSARRSRFPVDRISNDGLFLGTQQDVDLLVAFRNGRTVHLVMIEAKGDTGWRNDQLNAKAERLGQIFSDEYPRAEPIAPHFVLMSPARPKFLTKKGWPSWMMRNGEPLWLPLPLPDDLVKVTRYDPDPDRRPERYRYLRVDRIGQRTG